MFTMQPARIAAIFCAMLLVQQSAVAQQLIGPDVNPAQNGISTAQEASRSSHFRYAQVNPNALEHSAISLNLFGDLTLDATETRRGRQWRSKTWSGTVSGDPLSSVTISSDDSGLIFGKIETQGRLFFIEPKAGPIHAIVEVDRLDINESDEYDGVSPPETALDNVLNKVEAASVCEVATSCSSQTIDVMVVYTPEARAVLGGSDAMAQLAIANAVAEMDAAFAASGVGHTVNLVYSDVVDYVETNNSSTDLSRLSGTSDGYMDIVHTWRTTYGADLVSLVTDLGGCGLGYVQSNPTSYNTNAAFSTVRDDCLTSNRSLAHEMGHNMGLHHDWWVNSSTTPCAWNHGYVNQAAFVAGASSTKRWRTIMSYNDQCPAVGGFNCSRITYYSNPNNTYTSDPMGIPQGQSNPADNAFVLNRAACQVSGFRASATPQPPVADFSGTPTSGDYPLNVNFSDLSTNSPTSWSWTFGDGGSSTSPNPSHVYNAAGDYTVSLTVGNSEGSDAETKVAYIHVTVPEPPPADPTNLVATAVSGSQIDLTWDENATNETGYRVERSPNGSSAWSQIATLGVNASSYSNTGLADGTTYYYRTYAFHATGQSGYSNVANATTPILELVDHVASGFSLGSGTESGGYTATHSNGGGSQSITEGESNGKPSNRTSQMVATWQFQVRNGFPATLFINAWHSNSPDGDDFEVLYSDDGSSFVSLFTLGQTSDGDVYEQQALGVTTSSNLWIRIEDTDRSPGQRDLDVVFVDHMYVRTQATADPPPDAPILSASAAGFSEVSLSWSNVTNELGYRIERSDDGGSSFNVVDVVAADVTNYVDSGLSPETTYDYLVASFNGGGSTNSNVESVTTDPAPSAPELHLGDLVMGVSGNKRWTTTVTATVHNSVHGPIQGATVSGSWDAGGTASCTTSSNGTCSVSAAWKNETSVTFDVTNLSMSGSTYNSAANDVSTSVNGTAPDALRKMDQSREIPGSLALDQNYPNPFNPSTVIEYGLAESGHVRVSVFNTLGQEIAVLDDATREAGWHRVTFDAGGLPSGVYVTVVQQGGVTRTNTMLLTK